MLSDGVLAENNGATSDRPGSFPKGVRQSSQLAIQEFARPTVGKVSRGGVVVFSVMAGECVTLPRVAVHRRIWLLGKCCFNLRLCSLGNELIFLGQMHENGRVKPIDLSQIFISIGAVIPDRGVDAVATYGCHEDHERAQAIAEQGKLAVAFREIAYCVDGVLDIRYAGVSVISRIETKTVLPVGLRDDIQVN